MKLRSVILAGFISVLMCSMEGIRGDVRSTPKSPDKFIYIQSVPSQLDVYLILDSLIPEKKEEGEISWDEKKEFLKGRTPLKIELSPGDFHVAVVCDEKQLEKLDIAPKKGNFNSSAGKMIFDGCETQLAKYSIDEKSGLKVTYVNHYKISKKEGQPLALTALFADESVSHEKLLSLLSKPAAFRYNFDDKQWAPPLAEYGIGQNTLTTTMALLHRTGIVPYTRSALILKEGKAHFISHAFEDKEKLEKLLASIDLAGYELKIL